MLGWIVFRFDALADEELQRALPFLSEQTRAHPFHFPPLPWLITAILRPLSGRPQRGAMAQLAAL